MSDFLKKVLAAKQEEVAALKRGGHESTFKRTAIVMPLPPSFHDALRVPRSKFAIIGEIKRASPSAGDIQVDLDAAAQAKRYEEIGVSAVSVLTDETWFRGSSQDMLAAAQSTALPILCKDFIIDPVQLFRARAFGASAVLLIVALLDDDRLKALIRLAHSLSLEPFVEVHSSQEIKRALRYDGVRMIGINARDLKSLKVNLDTSRRLIHSLPESVVRVAESGIKSHETLAEFTELGFDAFLIGEHLSGANDVERAFAALMGDSGAE